MFMAQLLAFRKFQKIAQVIQMIRNFFLDFLKNTDMGLSLFEVNDIFDSFEKVLHNDKTGDIDKTNCN